MKNVEQTAQNPSDHPSDSYPQYIPPPDNHLYQPGDYRADRPSAGLLARSYYLLMK